jgi:hypothetical protein
VDCSRITDADRSALGSSGWKVGLGKTTGVIGSYFEPAGATRASGRALAQPLDDLVDAGCGGKKSVNEEVGDGKVSAESARKAAVAATAYSGEAG